jgi:cardiolipin synthase
LLYAIAAVVLIIMDRRSPQATFAWLLAFLALPVAGLIAYVMTGRRWQAFRRENLFVKRDIGAPVKQLLEPHITLWEDAQAFVLAQGEPIYGRILKLGHHSGISMVTLNNHVQILQDAQEKYPALMQDLRMASEFIHLQYFSWASDEVMDEFNNLLIQKVQEGVEVRLLYDAVGSFALLKRKDVRKLKEGGVQIEPFSPIYQLHTVSYRSHRKNVVIDGTIGYVGGLNMGGEHIIGTGNFSAWRDTHLRVEGEVVRALQGAFVQDWYHATRRKLLDVKYFPPVKGKAGSTPVQLLLSGPDSPHESIRQMFFYMIVSAQDHVYVQTPFFVLDESTGEALKAAALAGVDVRIMVAPQGGNENSSPYWASFTYMLDMAAAGVQIYLYQTGYLHAKTVSVDGVACTVGSANMDIRSFNIDYEMNAFLYDRALAQELEEDFRNDLKNCVLFDPSLYKKLPFRIRFRDAAARLLSPLL